MARYKFELDAVKLATSLIENNSNSRRFIWTVCGWAGTHHYAIMCVWFCIILKKEEEGEEEEEEEEGEEGEKEKGEETKERMNE